MDPLSIIASSITVAHALQVSIKAYRAYQNARPELMALHNEVSDLLVVLLELESSIQEGARSQSTTTRTPGLLQTVVNAKTVLEESLEDIGQWSQHPATNGNSQKSRINICSKLQVAKQAKRYQKEIKRMTQQLCSVLTIFGTTTTSRIEINVRQIMLLAQEQARVGHLREAPSPANVPSEEADCNGVEGSQVIPEDNFVESGILNEIDNPLVRALHGNSGIFLESSNLISLSAIGIRTSHVSRSVCKPWCSCVCHNETYLRTPQFLEKVVGALFVGYSGLPIFRPVKCSEQSCRLKAQPWSNITYIFPPWFLARSISLMLTTTPLAGPTFCLKTQRTVAGDCDLFTFAKLGEVEKMKSLFLNFQASPFDVHSESGVTALHLAISYRQIEVCRFLLQMNADAFAQDRTRWTAADNAWDKILMKVFSSEDERALRLMFSETDCIERREFTIIHKIVLGLLPVDLEQQLQISTAEVNAVDSSGKTALSMAAERAELEKLLVLLRYGASVRTESNCGNSPLHCAACASDPSCIQPLIDNGAIVDALTNWRQTPLTYVAAYTKDARHAEILLDAGADPNARDLDGITPLGWAVTANNLAVAKVLLSRDANVNNTDRHGATPFSQCIALRRESLLTLLLDHAGSDIMLDQLFPGSNTLLHIIAEKATASMMVILQVLEIGRIDVEARNNSNMRAVDILAGREDFNEQLKTDFCSLLKMQRVDANEETLSDSDEDSQWQDAVEFPET